MMQVTVSSTDFTINGFKKHCNWLAPTQLGYGLFLHYGLYSLLGRHEWVQFRERIPVARYEKHARLLRFLGKVRRSVLDAARSAAETMQ